MPVPPIINVINAHTALQNSRRMYKALENSPYNHNYKSEESYSRPKQMTKDESERYWKDLCERAKAREHDRKRQSAEEQSNQEPLIVFALIMLIVGFLGMVICIARQF